MSDGKIISFAAAPALFAKLRERGQRIVQSHGIFDLIHPGHIVHLEEARALGDVLVVTVTSDPFVNKGPGRPYFKEQLRTRSLAALSCVDYIVLVPFTGAVEAIACIRPHIYCKGKEYEDPDFDIEGNLPAEVRAVKRHGGQVRFTGSVKHSSTRLLNLYFDHLSNPVREFCGELAGRYTRRQFVEAVESLASLKILVVGETIFDRYSYMEVQGLTSKSRNISGRFLKEETHGGGALAVFRHVKQFTRNVKLISLIGTEEWASQALKAELAPGEDGVIRDPGYTTIVKQRFVEPLLEGSVMSKLFAVNYLLASPPAVKVQRRLLDALKRAIHRVDAVLLLDFGHGLLEPALRDLLQAEAPFLALNCQTNSNNHGFNIISRRYQRADAFSLDEQELLLAVGHRQLDHGLELARLKKGLQARYAWLTRGAVQTIGLHNDETPCHCPPLETDVVDTVGAGDAFFAVAAMAAARGLPVDLGTFLGQLAGAQAVKIVGNSRPVARPTLLQSGMSLLNL
jgi:rfaE bifunctional protein nucleotidyltransferase chain/domain